MKKEDNTWKVSTGVQIKSERDLTPKAIGGKVRAKDAISVEN